ncbi:MAG: dihydropteroate synthase [Synergistaceae bacterium]|nr:dihydropteroate synthase [Synergistaceae bacterium]
MDIIPLLGGKKLSLDKTLVMGILNITNDSFFTESRAAGEKEAVARAISMAQEGADIIDIGAESTRPGSHGVSEEAERDALIPAVRAIRGALPDVPISVDTRKASVAGAAIEAGADMINDVSGLELPEETDGMLSIIAGSGAAYVLTHTKGTPDVMQQYPRYDDTLSELRDFFIKKIALLESSGVSRNSLIIDPGIGFGKRISDNLVILANLEKFSALGLPVLIGASRKGFIGRVTGGDARHDPAWRLDGTLAITSLCALSGVRIVRVHDVAANRRVVDMITEISKHRL